MKKKLTFTSRIEGFLSGKSIEDNFFLSFKKRLSTKEIFLRYRNKDKNAENFINDYKEKQ